MKPIPISVQLYSVREQAAKDFPTVLAGIAAMGYVGVEFAGFHDMAVKDVKILLDKLGLVTSSIHGPMPTEANAEEIIRTARTLGFTRHISGFGPTEFATKETTLAAAATAQKAALLLKGSGVSFGIHNHDWEFDKKLDGNYPHEMFMAAAPDVFAQIDTYWVKTGGADPAAIVKKCGSRAPLLHIKDGPCKRGAPMTAVGAGVMDWKAVIGAAADSTEWLVVELDECATDMMDAVEQSYRHLVGNGFARGRK